MELGDPGTASPDQEPPGSIQGSLMPSINLSLIKDGNDNDVSQVTGQAGLILEIDPPGGPNGNDWGFKAGWGGFWD